MRATQVEPARASRLRRLPVISGSLTACTSTDAQTHDHHHHHHRKLAHNGFNEWFARKSSENDVSTPEQRITESFQSCFARTRHLLVERGAWQHGGIARTRYWARGSPEQRAEGRYEPFRFKDCASYDPPEPPPTDEVPWKEKDKYGNAVYSVTFKNLCSSNVGTNVSSAQAHERSPPPSSPRQPEPHLRPESRRRPLALAPH